MQDTSFAIHPGKKKILKDSSYLCIGSVENFKQENNIFEFVCEQGYVNLQFYRSDIFRVVMNPFGTPDMKSSMAVVKTADSVTVGANDKEETIELETTELTVVLKKSPFRISVYDKNERSLVVEGEKGIGHNNKEVICFKEMQEDDHFYGFGEKSGFLDKRGEKYTMWNSDVYAPHNPETDPLYQSIPYFMTLHKGKAHGVFFDNTFKTVFDLKTKNNSYSFSAEGGQLDYYVLAGPTPKDVLEQYTELTGKMPLPPKWALGYHQSRYSYKSEKEVRELANTFLEKKIPLDAIYLDIHYMDEYRVFTFDSERFPRPKQMVQDLKEQGIRTIPIVDPGVKVDPEYKIYQEGIAQDLFCKYIEGNLFFGDVWPGKSAFPDFTNTEVRQWWGEKHNFYSNLGIEGIWNDMNEPAVFNETKTMDVKVMHDHDGHPKTHREMHNLYGSFMGEATYEGMKKQLDGKRPFLLTRAGYAGVQRYGAVWTGDNRSFWEHLSMTIPMCMNLGLSGVALTGPDVGGFAHDSTGELLARWTQVGAFTPYFRNHNALDTVSQEPWSFGDKYEAIVKKYIELRYKWLPHLYTLFKEASETGLPVMRPLLMEYPEDEHTYNLSDQFLIGENVIVAPILQPDKFHRVVYLPEGTWYDYWNDRTHEGGQHILVEADLETIPLFVKAGTLLPEAELKSSTSVKDEEMTLHVYPQETGESTYTLYDDDGETFDYQEGKILIREIRCQYNGDSIKIEIDDQANGFEPPWKTMRLIVHQSNVKPDIVLNGQHLNSQSIQFDAQSKTATIYWADQETINHR